MPSVTLMATLSSLSPSMISSPARPVIVSLPGPPSRMSPSPQTGPVSGQEPETERDAVSAAVPGNVGHRREQGGEALDPVDSGLVEGVAAGESATG